MQCHDGKHFEVRRSHSFAKTHPGWNEAPRPVALGAVHGRGTLLPWRRQGFRGRHPERPGRSFERRQCQVKNDGASRRRAGQEARRSCLSAPAGGIPKRRGCSRGRARSETVSRCAPAPQCKSNTRHGSDCGFANSAECEVGKAIALRNNATGSSTRATTRDWKDS